MKIVTFELTEQLVEKLADRNVSDLLYKPAPGVEVKWGFTGDYGLKSEPVAVPSPAHATIADELSGEDGAKEIDITEEYVAGQTSAPDAYDGFGTMTLSQDGKMRVVAVRKEHEKWQEARYRSGLMGYARLEGA